jgi:hypothetical protein
LDLSVTNFTKNILNMNKNTKLILMTGGAIALAYALMEYYKRNVSSDSTPLPLVPDTDPTRASSFTAGDDFFANYVNDDFFGFTANEPFMEASGRGFLGKLKKKKGSSQRATQTRCATNLERLAMLNPNTDQYSAEVGKAYAREGSNFNAWASAKSNPCFVVGAEQGGLQSGGINFTAGDGFFNLEGNRARTMGKQIKPVPPPTVRPKKRLDKNNTGLNFTAGDNFFNAHGVPIATDEPNFKF